MCTTSDVRPPSEGMHLEQYNLQLTIQATIKYFIWLPKQRVPNTFGILYLHVNFGEMNMPHHLLRFKCFLSRIHGLRGLLLLPHLF